MTTVELWIGVGALGLSLLGTMNVWFLYLHKTKVTREEKNLTNLESRVNDKMSEATHQLEKMDLRVANLEKHSITESKTKELIDAAIKPVHENLDEIKRDGKEAQRDIKALLVGFSNLLGQLGQKPGGLHKSD